MDCQHPVNIFAVALSDTPVRFLLRRRGITPSARPKTRRGLQSAIGLWYNIDRQTETRVRNAIGSATGNVLSPALAPTEKG